MEDDGNWAEAKGHAGAQPPAQGAAESRAEVASTEGLGKNGVAAAPRKPMQLQKILQGAVDETEAKPSPLPRVIRLSSDADADLTSWYAQTFSNEISEVKKSIKLASDRVRNIRPSGDTLDEEDGESAYGSCRRESGSEMEGGEADSSVSSSIATKLEIALMQAKEQAESTAQQKEFLETRLACLEEVEELRMKVAAFELRELLEQKAEASPGAVPVPVWDRDEDHADCFRCGVPFSLTNRRHHCRRCGRIFCERCAPRTNATPIPSLGYLQPVRHCLDCLQPRSKQESTFAVSTVNSQPYSGAIDAIRRMENCCLRAPSSDALITALQSYVAAIEKIANSSELGDAHFRKAAHATLLRCMHAFLQMPQVQGCLDDTSDTDDRARQVISAAMSRAPPTPH